MSELWLALRDSVGLHATLEYEGESILIKDLPAGSYRLLRGGDELAAAIDPNSIPGFLLNYCAEREGKGERFKGITIPQKISGLQLKVVAC